MKKVFFTGLLALGLFSFTPAEEVVTTDEAGCTCTLEKEVYTYDEQGRVETITKVCMRQVCTSSNGTITVLTRHEN